MTTASLFRPLAAEALGQSPQQQLRFLEVEETDEEVVIGGTVQSYYLKQLAQETVRPILGHRRLLNLIKVKIRKAP